MKFLGRVIFRGCYSLSLLSPPLSHQNSVIISKKITSLISWQSHRNIKIIGRCVLQSQSGRPQVPPATLQWVLQNDATEFLIPKLVVIHFTSNSEPELVAVLSSLKVE